MKTKQILKIHDDFETKIENIIQYGLIIIQSSSATSKNEHIIISEGLLLRSCALWESFIEELVVHLISLDVNFFKKNMGLAITDKINKRIIRAILYRDRYQDFNNISSYKGQIKKYIVEKNNSFANITTEQIKKMEFTYTMRNYLSHYSQYSKRKLLQLYKLDYHLNNFHEPGSFLRKSNGKNFEDLLHNFALTSVSMRKKMKGV